MNSWLRTLLCAAVVGAACFLSESRAAVEPGQPAPDFTFTDIAGKAQKLSDYRGRIVVLEWVNPACTYVVRHYRSGNMQSTQAAVAAAGAVWLQINSMAMGDLDPAITLEWQKKQGVTAIAYIRDQSGKIGRLYGAKATPHCFVIGADGTLVYRGAIDDQPQASVAMTQSANNYVKAALVALHAGKAVEKSTTEAYGCEIKYGDER